MNEKFIMPARVKTLCFILAGLGLIGIIASYFIYSDAEGQHRWWANMLLNAVFFQGITINSGFFLAATYVAYGGWHVVLKRVPEAVSMFVPFSALLLLIVLAAGHSYLYEWTDPNFAENDPIVRGKTPYLNLPFFFIRFAFFVGILMTLIFLMRKNSKLEDEFGGLSYYRNNLTWASLFLLFFAIYILITAWDWLMSLDVHWYSTMFGWYSFASFWVTSIAVNTLLIIYLRRKGYLGVVNENHLHEMGLLMFAFSIFWTYVTFCQFMLIWYANIPEETAYFRERYDHYMWLFYGIFILNFVAPFLIFMSRDAKRKAKVLTIGAIIILIGHYIDFYLIVMPGVVGNSAGFGLIEISTPLFFAGVFLYVVFTNLSKANLVPKQHPFLDESLHHTL